MKDDNLPKESLLSRLEVLDVKELSKEELKRLKQWRKISQELMEKGASTKDLMGAYEEIFDFEKEVSIQSTKDLLKGIFDDDDDEPAAAAAASLSKTKSDDDDPFSFDPGSGPEGAVAFRDDNGGPGPGGAGAFRNDNGGPDPGGVGAINDSLETIHYDNPFARGGSKRDPFSLDGGGPPPSAPLKEIFENRDRGPGPGPGAAGALAEPIRVQVSEKQAEISEDIYDKVFPDSPTMDSPAYKASLANRLTNVNVGKSKSGKKKSEEGPSLDR